MAENVTPVVLEIDGFAQREVLMIDYKFDQATDREGQIAGILRGGRVTIRVKALIDRMTQAVHDFVGDAEQSDDLTMLVVQYHKHD